MKVKYLKNRGIDYIYHATPYENLIGIINSDGLISRLELQKRQNDYIYVDDSRYDGRLDFISCSYNDINDRYFSQKNYSLKNNLIRFKIDVDILNERQALFFYGNAASTHFRSMTNEELSLLDNLKQTFSESIEVYTTTRGYDTYIRSMNDPKNIPTSNQAEIMIGKSIPLKYIREIYAEFVIDEDIVKLLTDLNINVIDKSGSNEKMLEDIRIRDLQQYQHFNDEHISSYDYEEVERFKRVELDYYSQFKNKIYFNTIYNNPNNNGKIKIYNLKSIFSSNSISKYKQFYAVLYNMLNRSDVIEPSNILKREYKAYDLNLVLGIQFLILNLIKQGYLNDNVWNISNNKNQNLIDFAIKDIFSIVKIIAELADVEFIYPKIVFSDNPNAIKILIEEEPKEFNEYAIFFEKGKKNVDYPPLWIEDKIVYRINENKERHINVLSAFLKQIFNHEQFRDSQVKILANYLNGANTIGILPTGHGKSLIFYFAVIFQPTSSIVIAPINALIQDQTNKLRDKYNIKRYIVLTSDNENMMEDLDKFHNSLFTFASPERLQTASFRNRLIALYNLKFVGQVILDEVHCLSEWGHDFRVSYLMLSETLNNYCGDVSYLGLTATAQVKVINDLRVELNIQSTEDIIYNKSLRRENLTFVIKELNSKNDLSNEINHLFETNYKSGNNLDLANKDNSYVVFTPTIENQAGANTLFRNFVTLNSKLSGHASVYHSKNKNSFDDFMNGHINLLFATKAFGMGIDKSNIRFTIHAGMTSSREAYYQEAGRAGRDNLPSYCLLYTINPSSSEQSMINELLQSKEEPHVIAEKAQQYDRRTHDSDLWTPLFFFRRQFSNPEKETRTLEKLYDTIVQGERNFKVFDNNYSNDYLEKDFYMLHKLGIIKNWIVSWYSDHQVLVIDANVENFNNLNKLKDSANRYITSYNLSMETDFELIYLNEIKEAETFYDIVYNVKKWYHKTFIDLKLQQIKNMYEFVKKYKLPSLDDRLVDKTSNDIQNEMDMFFDLSNLLDVTSEGYHLEFRENQIDEVIRFAFELPIGMVERRIIELERLFESVQNNNKTDIYYGLLNLRNDMFEDNKGFDRLNNGYITLSEDNKIIFLKELAKHFNNLSFDEKQILLSVLELDIRELTTMYESNQNDTYIVSLLHHYINQKLEKTWGIES